ncbi:MAG TPA: acyltransferase, partial [Acidimicrobiales bacterium]|nr:acyltransferase [Acidimicrobiales bacterium]
GAPPDVSTRAVPVFAPPTAPPMPDLPAEVDPYGAPDPVGPHRYAGVDVDDLPDDEADRPAGRGRPARSAPGRRPELPYVAAFDGLRAVALLAILAFHQGFEVARGGFLGISSFFTLSGFLVATIALAEWARNGSLALGRFWQHRARRLVPAFAVTVALVVVLQVILRVGSVPGYRGDVLAALGQVLNWRYAFGDSGFARVLTDPSPVQHLWSISLLAQVTLLLPIVFVGLMRLTGTRWRRAGAAFAVLAAASFAAAWFTAGRSGNDGMAYFSTHTRVGELLVGVVLAYVVLSPGVRRAVASPAGGAAMRYGTPVALLVLAGLWMSTGLYSTNLFGGITAINALLTAWVIFAVTIPGPATTVLGSRPLRLLGGISFAAYLLHWPLFLLLDEDRIGFDGVPLFLVRLAATLVAGAALTYAIERPIRTRLRAAPGALAVGCVAALAAIAVAVVVLPEQPPRGVTLAIGSGDGPGQLDVVSPSGGEAASIALVGGSLAESMTPGLEAWNAEHPDQQVRVATHVAADCPLSGAGEVRSAGRTVGDDTSCLGFEPRLPRLLDAADPDVVVVVPDAAELGAREIDNEWVHLGDPVYDQWVRQHLDDVADTLAEAGVPVVWATSPHVRLAPGGDLEGDWTDVPDNDPGRVDRLNEIVRAAAAARDDMSVIDLGAWAQRLPRGEFAPDQRAEGRDLTEDGAARAAAWMLPELFDVLGISVDEAAPAD